MHDDIGTLAKLCLIHKKYSVEKSDDYVDTESIHDFQGNSKVTNVSFGIFYTTSS